MITVLPFKPDAVTLMKGDNHIILLEQNEPMLRIAGLGKQNKQCREQNLNQTNKPK